VEFYPSNYRRPRTQRLARSTLTTRPFLGEGKDVPMNGPRDLSPWLQMDVRAKKARQAGKSLSNAPLTSGPPRLEEIGVVLDGGESDSNTGDLINGL